MPCPLGGVLLEYCEARLSPLGIGAEQVARRFSQGDACNLKPKYQGYDLVLAANLIEQLRDPKRFLLDVAHRLNAGGILVLSSTYHWQESQTPKEHWLGEIGRTARLWRAIRRCSG